MTDYCTECGVETDDLEEIEIEAPSMYSPGDYEALCRECRVAPPEEPDETVDLHELNMRRQVNIWGGMDLMRDHTLVGDDDK